MAIHVKKVARITLVATPILYLVYTLILLLLSNYLPFPTVVYYFDLNEDLLCVPVILIFAEMVAVISIAHFSDF